MDKHRRLHDLLVTQGAAVDGMVPYKQYSYGLTEPPVLLSPMFMRDRRPVDNGDAAELIELAAIKWLLKNCMGFSLMPQTNGTWYWYSMDRPSPQGPSDTLIDALHAAVERECANSKSDLEIEHD